MQTPIKKQKKTYPEQIEKNLIAQRIIKAMENRRMSRMRTSNHFYK